MTTHCQFHRTSFQWKDPLDYITQDVLFYPIHPRVRTKTTFIPKH